ncbi:MAG: RidA family protein [Bradyrhizobium sp.]|nr:MAG: RidA family protein [Bradyrhizobium sp.]
MNIVAKRLEELGLRLPKAAAPVANYVACVRSGALLFVSGQLPFGSDGKIAAELTGKLAADSPIEPATAAARQCAINLLAQAQSALGDLDRVARVVRLGGFFAIEGRFERLPQAMNGASDLMADVFGERGRHVRTTVGVAHLPLDALAEVEGLFEIAP